MRILRNLIIILLLLVLAGISIVGLMVELPTIFHYQPTRINELGRSFIKVMRPGYGLFWMWFALAAASLLVLAMTIIRPRKQMKIEVQMGGGRVVIMDSAIKRYIRSALAELPGITVRRIDLRDTRLGVSTDLYTDVRAQGNLPVLERQMIQRVRAALAEDLGITSIGEVHVYIRDFEVAERVPVHTAVRRPHARESREEESEPEPAHTVELTRPTSTEYTKPSSSTGPFDQVPMPANRSHQPSSGGSAAYSATLVNRGDTAAGEKPAFRPFQSAAEKPATEAEASENYFLATPGGIAGATTAQVTDLGPKEIYALAEAAGETGIESSTEASGAVDGAAESESGAAERPKKRGLFGLFGGSESAGKPSAGESSPAAEVKYDPETATESVESIVDAESTDLSVADEPSTDASAKDEPSTT
ncbi:MAG: alkaline shock response membrane anchor protein AmaP [Candidatus Sumerlaeaceae bacterium]